MFAVLKGYLLSKPSRKRLGIISEKKVFNGVLKIESEELPDSITAIISPRLKVSVEWKLRYFSH